MQFSKPFLIICFHFDRALFELMTKSMVEYLYWSGAHEAPRKARFPDQFTDDLSTLVNNVTAEIISKLVDIVFD